MSNVLWLSASSPLFVYSPAPAYFSNSSFTSPWTGALDASLSPPNNSYKSTTGPSAFILPSVYGEFSVSPCEGPPLMRWA